MASWNSFLILSRCWSLIRFLIFWKFTDLQKKKNHEIICWVFTVILNTSRYLLLFVKKVSLIFFFFLKNCDYPKLIRKSFYLQNFFNKIFLCTRILPTPPTCINVWNYCNKLKTSYPIFSRTILVFFFPFPPPHFLRINFDIKKMFSYQYCICLYPFKRLLFFFPFVGWYYIYFFRFCLWLTLLFFLFLFHCPLRFFFFFNNELAAFYISQLMVILSFSFNQKRIILITERTNWCYLHLSHIFFLFCCIVLSDYRQEFFYIHYYVNEALHGSIFSHFDFVACCFLRACIFFCGFSFSAITIIWFVLILVSLSIEVIKVKEKKNERNRHTVFCIALVNNFQFLEYL